MLSCWLLVVRANIPVRDGPGRVDELMAAIAAARGGPYGDVVNILARDLRAKKKGARRNPGAPFGVD